MKTNIFKFVDDIIRIAGNEKDLVEHFLDKINRMLKIYYNARIQNKMTTIMEYSISR